MQRDHVKAFFDRLAPSYRQRYDGSRVFLKYLHEERVEKALEGLDLQGKNILDIGAGTGILYERMLEMGVADGYYACDISAPMLAQSRIPVDRRWVGAPEDCDFPVEKFDLIFVLGVTTYLSPEEFTAMLEFIAKRLQLGGTAILSFSHSASLDFRIRRLFAWLAPKAWLKNTVLGQPFPFRGYRAVEVERALPEGLLLSEIRWLNATVFPFSRLAPGLSVFLSKAWLKRSPPEVVCGDFLGVVSLVSA
jgi:2-polyprenyl-3-methyl-5-hydroxy-6-metoxy-1,4-benzoquinol methylase